MYTDLRTCESLCRSEGASWAKKDLKCLLEDQANAPSEPLGWSGPDILNVDTGPAVDSLHRGRRLFYKG